MKKGISLVGIKDIKTVRDIVKQYPDCFFELSYLSTQNSLDEVLPLIEGRVASVHLLCPQRSYFPNLADEQAYKWSEIEILKDATLAKKIGATNLVLHPGYLINGLLSTDYEKRLRVIQDANLQEFMLENSNAVCKVDYIKSPRYRKAFETMLKNAKILNKKIQDQGLNLCLENLNPRAGYMVLHPDEMKILADEGLNLCLDIGHIQVNAALFGFDVFEAVCKVLDTGKVKTMHLHSNASKKGYYEDAHKSFDKYLPCYCDIIQKAKEVNSNLILEVLEEPIRNIELII